MRVLIFGAGKQGKKYINFFYNNGYIVDIITNKNLFISNKINKSYIYNDLLLKNLNFKLYKYIILAIFPIKNQTKIIKELIELNIKNYIIIEKPVTYDFKLLYNLINYNNITYNIDELFFDTYILNNLGKIKNIEIFSIKNDYALEHSLGLYLLDKSFSFYLNNIKINFIRRDFKDLYYKNIVNGNYIIENKFGSLFFNNNIIGNLAINNSIKFSISLLNTNKNLLLKINYLYLKKFILRKITGGK